MSARFCGVSMVPGRMQLTVDARVLVLRRQGLGEGDYRGLGGTVGAHLGLALARRAGRHVDDAPAAARQHPRHYGTAMLNTERAFRFIMKSQSRSACLVQRWTHGETAGDVGQHIDAAIVRADCSVHGVAHRGGIEQVGGRLTRRLRGRYRNDADRDSSLRSISASRAPRGRRRRPPPGPGCRRRR